MKNPSLTGKAASGVAWSMLYQVGRQLLSLASVAVLARKVPPSAYGLLAMAAVIINFFDSFSDLGTGPAIIREREISNRLLSSIFWLNIGLGGIVALAIAALAVPAAVFFHQPALTPIMRALAVTFVLLSLAILPTGLLNRAMAFRAIAIAQLAGAVTGTGTAITLALLGAGVWSLVLGTLVTALVTTICLWIASPWRPQLVVDWLEIRSIASYSLHLSGFNFLAYFSRNADNLIVGRFLGDVALGYYQMAYTLMTYPLANVSSVIARALFPAFATLQDDDERFRSAFTRTCMLVGAVTIPAMLGLTVVAGPFVEVMLGPRWQPVTGLLLVFAPLGMFQSIYTLTGLIYNAKKRSDLLLRWGLFSGAIYVLSFFLGLHWGIQGIADSYSVAWILLMVPGFTIAFRLVGLSWLEFLTAMWPALAAGAAMALVALTWRLGLNWVGISNPAMHLFSTAAVGCVSYLGLLLWWKPPVVSEAAMILEEKGFGRLALLLS